MTTLFRAMKEDALGMCEVGESARTLGVRPGIDVLAKDPNAIVQPSQGGLSVSPDEPRNLPLFRRPPEFGGTGKDPVWEIDSGELGANLQYRTDATNPGHGFVEPVRPMTLAEFQQALADTQAQWHKATLGFGHTGVP